MPEETLPPLASYRGFSRGNTPLDPEHTASRPDWNCRACGAEWPCEPAKAAMRAEAQRTYLGMLMWGFLEDFAHDATEEQFRNAHDRFIAWTRG
ncbi:flavin reductase [Actinoplanes sp. NPDC026619]|uniref:flavin reductase n=1 Tax=Actinoplanes sp. NPDC026619 TaxID=3155798 RepID=UPI0033F96C78